MVLFSRGQYEKACSVLCEGQQCQAYVQGTKLAVQKQRLGQNRAYSRIPLQQILTEAVEQKDRLSFHLYKVSTFESVKDALINDLLCFRVKL